MNVKDRISIIIVTWNSEDVIGMCVHALLKHPTEIICEIILVDNHSKNTEYLLSLASHEKIRLIKNSGNLGYSKAVNLAAETAQGNYLLVLNPDIVVKAQTILELLDELKKDPTIGVIGPLLRYADGTPQKLNYYPDFPSAVQSILLRTILGGIPFIQKILLKFFHAKINLSKINYVDQIPGAFFLFESGMFSPEKPLSEKFFIWFEDVDFCRRVHYLGKKVAVDATKTAYHFGGTSFSKWDRTRSKTHYFTSYLTYMRLHHSIYTYLFHAFIIAADQSLSSIPALAWGFFKGQYSLTKDRIKAKYFTLVAVWTHIMNTFANTDSNKTP